MRWLGIGLGGVDKLVKAGLIKRLLMIRDSGVSRLISNRIREFRSIDRNSPKVVMRELAYCILTANCRADRVLEIESDIGDKYLYLSREELRDALKRHGYRFPNLRSRYIVEARRNINRVISLINQDIDTRLKRVLLVNLIKGFGYKEASHFLRNIGFLDVAIIDRHILGILQSYGYVDKNIRLTPQNYLKVEKIVFNISSELDILPGELDLYLWFLSTGKVLK